MIEARWVSNPDADSGLAMEVWADEAIVMSIEQRYGVAKIEVAAMQSPVRIELDWLIERLVEARDRFSQSTER